MTENLADLEASREHIEDLLAERGPDEVAHAGRVPKVCATSQIMSAGRPMLQQIRQ